MKLVSTLFLLMALFSSTVLAEGNMGNGGRTSTIDTKATVKGGMTTEDGDPPPPPPPPCVPTPEAPCDGGNMGNGGRSAVMDLIQKYLFSLFD